MLNNLIHNYNHPLNYSSNFGDLDIYKEKIINHLKGTNSFLYVIQIETSLFLDGSIYNKWDNEKLKYLDKKEITLISELEEKVREEWIWYYYNDNKKYTEEFNNKIEKLKEENPNKNIDDIYKEVTKEYTDKMANELGLSNVEKEKMLEIRKDIQWKRKYEIPLVNWDKLPFDYRNWLTTIYWVWNYKDWITILWIWWGGSSFQRQTFSEMSYIFYEIIKEDNKKSIKDHFYILNNFLYYYDEFNNFKEIFSQHNQFFIDYDLWSNTNLFHNEKKDVKEEMIWKLPQLKAMRTFFDIKDEEEYNNLFDKVNFPFQIQLWKNKKEGLLYFEFIDDNTIELYFWDIENAYGDDWNDTPSNLNSWNPYDEFLTNIIYIKWEKNKLDNTFQYSDNLDEYNYDHIKENKLEIFTNNWESIKYWDDKIQILKKIKGEWFILEKIL